MRKVALVTGANGFVGSVLADHLRSRGWEVRASGFSRTPLGQETFACDITDEAQIAALLHWAGPVTHVFHLAAITFIPLSQSAPVQTMDVNLNGTIRLADAVRSHSPGARFLYVGSAAVYGVPQEIPITETHPLQPNEPYAISKAAADAYCGFLHQNYNADVIRLRPFNHAGPGQSSEFVLSNFARQIARMELQQEPPVLHVGNLDVARDFLHVRDVVEAYELIAASGAAGEAYNVCSGNAWRIRDALECLRELATVKFEIETDHARMRRVEIPEVRGARAKITTATGWEPRVPFEALMRELIEHWREREAARTT